MKMKLILAVVNPDDSGEVMRLLTKDGFRATKISTSGGFMSIGNLTLMIACDENEVDHAVQIIQSNSHKRMQAVPSAGGFSSYPVELMVGGSTIMILDIERFERA